MNIKIFVTDSLFDREKYGQDSIVRQSKFFTVQVDPTKPSFLRMFLDTNMLEDESSYMQYGQSIETEYFTWAVGQIQPSSWIYFPTEKNPSTLFKYVSVEVNMSLHLMLWERQTYSLLDWLGHLGGLYDALFHLAKVLISPISVFAVNSTLLSNLFRFKRSMLSENPQQFLRKKSMRKDEKERNKLCENIANDFKKSEKIKPQSFIQSRLLCCMSKKGNNYRKLMMKSSSTIQKEMDLQKFIHRQRVTMASMMAALTGHQKSFIDKYSQLIIRESSDLCNTSSDAQLSDWQREDMRFTKRMTLSQNLVDKRLVNLFKIRRAETRKDIEAVIAEEEAEQPSASIQPDSFAQDLSSSMFKSSQPSGFEASE